MKEIKALLLLLSLFIPIVADAMKIETDEIDEFTEQRTLITSWESLCNKRSTLDSECRTAISY